MSLKRTIFLIGAIIALLLPAALMLKNQNPWSCFAFTLDESFYAQAATNWADGKGYRMYGTLPFDPTITAGIPLAWGATLLRGVTGEDIANSGRIFVYLTFIATLLSVARSAFLVSRNWLAVPMAIWIFAFALSKAPSGGYFAFGMLGEMPGLFFSVFAYRALDRKQFARAGVFSVMTFVMKPSFLFFLPAIALAAALYSGKAAIRAGVAQVLALLCVYSFVLAARNESLFEYFSLYLRESRRIAHDVPPGSLFDFYAKIGLPVLALSIGYFAIGGLATLRARKSRLSMVAAFLMFTLACAYFLAIGHRPVEKQWGAVIALAALGFAAPLAATFARRFAGAVPREFARASVIAVIATWALSVGQSALHAYKRRPETVCPSKEQTIINEKLHALVAVNEVDRGNLGVVIAPDSPHRLALYRLGWNPEYGTSWSAFKGRLPKWVYGETRALYPAPDDCVSYFPGESFALLKCAK